MKDNDDNFKYHIGDKVYFNDWFGDVKKGKIIGCRSELRYNHISRYYAIKTLFSKEDIKEDNIYGLVVRPDNYYHL